MIVFIFGTLAAKGYSIVGSPLISARISAKAWVDSQLSLQSPLVERFGSSFCRFCSSFNSAVKTGGDFTPMGLWLDIVMGTQKKRGKPIGYSPRPRQTRHNRPNVEKLEAELAITETETVFGAVRHSVYLSVADGLMYL